MNARTRPYVLLGLIAVAALATLWSIRRTLDAKDVRHSRLATFRDLEELAADSAKQNASQQAAAAVVKGTAVDLAAGAATAVQGLVVRPEKTDRTVITAGWSLRIVQLALDDASFQDAGRLIEWAENQQPAWRLSASEFWATSPGRGKALLTFQALEREALPKP